MTLCMHSGRIVHSYCPVRGHRSRQHRAGSSDTPYTLVSDDGGSSSEILRVLGGPAIGDIRSRLIRLIPTLSDNPLALDHLSEGATAGTQAVHDLFAHRFPTNCTENQAKGMWADLVEGKSSLWTGVPADRRECIRCKFLFHNHPI
jgi:hypothetical protein